VEIQGASVAGESGGDGGVRTWGRPRRENQGLIGCRSTVDRRRSIMGSRSWTSGAKGLTGGAKDLTGDVPGRGTGKRSRLALRQRKEVDEDGLAGSACKRRQSGRSTGPSNKSLLYRWAGCRLLIYKWF
jgi:hypothetical protein